jgi:hypothetical protein
MKEKNLLELSKILFQDKKKWGSVTDSEKSAFFFIINRYFAKKYPDLSLLLNEKDLDKVAGMNLWYYFMLDKPYPNWFWSKSVSEKKTEEENFKLLEKYDLKADEFEILQKYYPEEVKEELDYQKKLLK